MTTLVGAVLFFLVRLMVPQFVKAYVKANNERRSGSGSDLQAVDRPDIRFVPARSVEQQYLQALHRLRTRLIANRTQLSNQVRGLLAEYGIVLPKQLSQLRRALPVLLEDGDNELTPLGRGLFASLFEELLQLDKRIESFDKQLAGTHRQSPHCRRIAEVGGIGPITATVLVAAICDGKSFTNERQLAAWLGSTFLLPLSVIPPQKRRCVRSA